MAEFAEPLQGLSVLETDVDPAWIDLNNHMNVAYYLLVFDLAVDRLWQVFGIDDSYRERTLMTTFAAESHLKFLREVAVSDPLIVTTQIVAADRKKIHQFQRLYAGEERRLAATCEWMNVHVSQITRRVAPWESPAIESIMALRDQHAELDAPVELGASISMRRKSDA